MKQKTLIQLVLALAVLGALGWWLQRDTGPVRIGGVAAGEKVFPALDVNAVTRLTVASATHTAVVERAETGWQAVSLHGHPASFAVIADFLMKLNGLEVGQVLRGGDEMPGEFGLDPAAGQPDTLAITLATGSGAPVAFLLGALKHQRDAQSLGLGMPTGRFMRVGDGPVLLIDELFTGVSARTEDWVDRTLLAVPANEVQTVTVVAQADEYTVRREDDRTFNAGTLPEGRALDQNAVLRLVQALQNLRFDTVLAPEASTALAAAADLEQVTFATERGRSYTLRIGRDPENESQRPVWVEVAHIPLPPPSRAVSHAEADRTFVAPDPVEGEAAPDLGALQTEHQNAVYAEALAAHEAAEAARAAAVAVDHARLSPWGYLLPARIADALVPARTDLLLPEPEPAAEPAAE